MGLKPGVPEAARELGVEVWLLPDLMQEIAAEGRKGNSYFGDDTLRTITLFARGISA
ncbi:hypothetical protein [Pelagerythrobacter rhizovicinus]|uniref:hypothetical protein n=1 Tax=Pelagerythrobacter rhizovicinus TaxID=2268576 RepID=UPI0013EE0FC7|nr:hypothetical protein [Pelagerythrobacter rhizovicinus]